MRKLHPPTSVLAAGLCDLFGQPEPAIRLICAQRGAV